MTATEIRAGFQAGQITAEQLLDIIERQEQRFKTLLERYQRELERLTARLAQYEPEVRDKTPSGNPPSSPSPTRYSLGDEAKRRQHRR